MLCRFLVRGDGGCSPRPIFRMPGNAIVWTVGTYQASMRRLGPDV
jgi:hypothetical protein